MCCAVGEFFFYQCSRFFQRCPVGLNCSVNYAQATQDLNTKHHGKTFLFKPTFTVNSIVILEEACAGYSK